MVVSAWRSGALDASLAKEAFGVADDQLRELGGQLDVLRRKPGQVDASALIGSARVMADAVIATGDPDLTPMASVAGTIADAAADHIFALGAERVCANNGGDAAIRLAAGQSIAVGVCCDLERGAVDRTVRIVPEMEIGGAATSGLGGRSLTTGIASGVTVFSRRCADADAIATLLADRSFIDVPAVRRVRAGEIDPDSDIADLDVVVEVGELSEGEIERALGQVMSEAARQYGRGGMRACIATVRGRTETYDPEGILR